MAERVTTADVYRRLGELTARVDALIEHQARADTASERSRAATAERLDAMAAQQQAMDARLGRAEEALVKIKPFVDDANKWRQRGIGALWVFGMLCTAAGAALASTWREMIAALRGI